ncbi:unnamed protein product, partial [Polarella glacialis]
RVRILQVRQTSGGLLTCTQLADVVLGKQAEVPVWLRSEEGGSSSVSRSSSGGLLRSSSGREVSTSGRGGAGGCSGGESSDAGVLAIAAVGCQVKGAPAALGLCGTAALAITAEAAYLVWGHRRCAERIGDVASSPLGAASATASESGTSLLAACLSAFTGSGEILQLSLGPELQLSADGLQQCLQEAALGSSAADLSSLLADPEDADLDPPICSVQPLGPIPTDSILGRALAPSRASQ